MSRHLCRHERHRKIRVSFLAALSLILTGGVLRVGVAVGSSDLIARVTDRPSVCEVHYGNALHAE